jgi:hypothetical protein
MLPRRIRAKIGAFVAATANMIWSKPRSSQTTIPIARRMPGIASRTSTTHEDRVDLATENTGHGSQLPNSAECRHSPSRRGKRLRTSGV